MGEAVAELRQALSLDPTFVPARSTSRTSISSSDATSARVRSWRPRNTTGATECAVPDAARRGRTATQEPEACAGAPEAGSGDRQRVDADPLLPRPDPARSRATRADAITELEGVVKAGEKRADVYLSLGAAYLDAGRLDEGLETLSQATHLDAARPDIRIQLARGYRLKGQLRKADAQLAIANPKGPASVVVTVRPAAAARIRLLSGTGTAQASAGTVSKRPPLRFARCWTWIRTMGPRNRDLADVYLRQGQYVQAARTTRPEPRNSAFRCPTTNASCCRRLQKQKQGEDRRGAK